MPFNLDWTTVGANGSYTLADGPDSVGVTVATTTNALSETASAYSGGSPAAPALWVTGISEPITSTLTFAAPVSNFSFEIYDIDSSPGSWDDKLTVLVTDAQGNVQAVNFGDLLADPYHSSTGNVLNADGTFNGGVETIGAEDSVSITIAGPVSKIEFIFDNGESFTNSGMFGVGNMSFERAALDFIVEGTAGDDLIGDAYVLDPDGDRVNAADAANGSDDDVIQAGAGNDTVVSGAGNDSIDAGIGNDSVASGSGDDTILGGAGADTVISGAGADVIYGGAEADSLMGEGDNDAIYGGDGADYVDGDSGDDTLYGDAGADTLVGDDGNDVMYGGADDDQIYDAGGNNLAFGGAGNDLIFMASGNDTIDGGTGNDAMSGAGGDDTFALSDNFGNDTITGGETGETSGDTLDLSSTTTGVRVDLTSANPESGSVSDGTSTATFTEIENIVLGRGADTLVLADGSGADRVTGFQAPIDNGDGTFAGVDLLDVTGLHDLGGDLVNVLDVVVTDTVGDGSGDAILTFPNGESLTLVGVLAASVSSPAQLAAMGLPMNDGIVYGTVGDDTIDASYLGDNDGDVVDGNDAVLPGAAPNDDLIYAGAGNDSVTAGLGNDSVVGQDGDDTLNGNDGDDTLVGDFEIDDDISVRGNPIAGPGGDDVLFGGLGEDSIYGGSGNDSLYGGDGNDSLLGGHGNDLLEGGAGDDELEGLYGDDTIYGGDGNDHVFGRDGADLIYGGDGVDTLVGSIGIDTIYGGAGNDILAGSQGSDLIYGGTGDDLVFIGVPAPGDIAYDNEGSIYLDEGNDFLDAGDATLRFDAYGGEGNDYMIAGVGDDTLFGGTGDDQIFAGAGDDQLTGDGGDDYIEGQSGDDTFNLADGFGTDTLVGGEAGETDGDVLDASALTTDSVLDLSAGDATNPEDGTLTVDPTGGAGASPAIHYVRVFKPDASVSGFGVYPSGAIDFSQGEWFYVPVADMDIFLEDSQGITGGGGGLDATQSFAADFDGLSVSGNGIGAAGKSEYLDANGNPFFVGWISSDYNGATGVPANTYLIVTDAGGAEPTGMATSTGLRDPNAQFDYSSFTTPVQLANFSEIERFVLGSGDDSVIGSEGDDDVSTGAGADTVDGGAGNDSFDLGAADGVVDYVVMSDGDGSDTISAFEAPIDNGDGTYTGRDQLDVSDLTSDGGTTPVTTADVIVSDTNGDGTGDAILTFPGGESITLVGVLASQVDTPAELEAIGIPRTPEAVDGTAAGDLMPIGYVDAQGDIIDGADGLDDTIYGYAGDDTITAGLGNDLVFAGDDNDSVAGGAGDDLIYGGTGNDTLNGGDDADTIFGDAGADNIEGDTGDDLLWGGLENDTVAGGAGADTLHGEDGNDSLRGGADNDTLYGGGGNDTIQGDAGDDYAEGYFGDDVMSGGIGADTLDGGDGNDQIFGGDDNDFLMGGNGQDQLDGGSGNDTLWSGAGDDTLIGGAGNDTMIGEGGDDTFTLSAGFGTDVIQGDEAGEINGDTIDASAITSAVVVDLSAGNPGDPESGTLISGSDVATFNTIENIVLGAGNDSVIGSSGADRVATGAGADTVDGGAGDDSFALGADGDADVVRLSDGDGNDTVSGFDAPIINPDGTFSGVDQLDVSALFSTPGNPVNVDDVTVADDGAGNAVLTFPNGEAVTLEGVDPALAADPNYLIALGIPSNYIVEGTSGADVIDASYSGDPEGDMIDANDNLAGNNDDVVQAGAGNDSVFSGTGNDLVYGGTGDDVLQSGLGDDTLYGGDGNDRFFTENGQDVVYGGAGNDTAYASLDGDLVYGGDGADSLIGGGYSIGPGDSLYGDAGDDTLTGGGGADLLYGGNDRDLLQMSGPLGADTLIGGEGGIDFDTVDLQGVGTGLNVLYSANEAGTITDGAATATFAEIEAFNLTEFNDNLNGSVSTLALSVFAGAGSDTITGGSGADTIFGGLGDDLISGGLGNDSIRADEGDDTVYGGGGNDTIFGFEGSDSVDGGDGDDFINTRTSTGTGLPDQGYSGLYAADTDPNNDRDTVEGGAGNDTILTGDDDDLIYGGSGADSIDAGFDDDTVYGGSDNDTIIGNEGNDYVEGGLGNDVIYGGLAVGVADISSIPDATDLLPGNGLDTLYGGDGSDLIYGMDDADLLFGDAGTDTLYGGIDNDSLYGGDGADSLYGDEGDDRIEAGAGDDAAYGGDGNDLIIGGGTGVDALFGDTGNDTITGSLTGNTLAYGGDGNDSITGGNLTDQLIGDDGDDIISGGGGADVLSGDAGNDTLYGGAGADNVSGGAGNDTIDGGEGADTLYGDDDRDLFYGGIGDVIDGGEGGDDFDTLNLTALGGAAMTNVIYGGGNDESGTVEVLDGGGVVVGSFTFSNIESVVPCFTPGTLIMTNAGEKPVEDLIAGDRVLTRDNGYQTIRWVGMRRVSGHELAANPNFNPVCIQAGALGCGLPQRDMTVSPQHRMLVTGPRAEMLFGDAEVLVAAAHLINDNTIRQITPQSVTYIHLLFDQHEIIRGDGAWTESFQPGDLTLQAMDSPQRDEIFALFPTLQIGAGYPAARQTLKSYEAKVLMAH